MELETTNKERLDELEIEMRKHEQKECPLIHRFTKGLYIREIYMPANTLIISKVHRTEHPFFVMKGIVDVKINDGEWQRIEAPYSDVTLPGTRRVLFVVEDTVWATTHLNEDDTRNLDLIEERIIEKSDNPLLQPMHKEQNQLI